MFCGLFDDVIGRYNEPISWLKVLLWMLGYNTSL